MPRRWRSLPLQLFALTVLPLAVLLLAIAFASLNLHQAAMRTMVGERDERAIRAAAAAITEQLHHRRNGIRSLALQAANADSLEHALADAAFMLPDFEGGVAIFAPDGTLHTTSSPEMWQSPAVTEALANFGGASASSQASYETQFMAPIVDPISGAEWMLAVAAVNGFHAVGAFSPARLAQQALANIFGSNDQAAAYIVTPDGRLLYQSGTIPEQDNPILDYPGVAEALRGESGTTYLNLAGEEHVIAFSPIVPVGWALIMAEPWRVVADPLLRATELAPLILLPVLLVALVALWFGVRQIVRPLQSLEKKATSLGWGDFDAIEEPVGGINEIQRLQAELVHMAQKVQLAQQNLRGYLGAVTTGQEEERRRLARELHDDTIQSLIALNQQIQLAQLSIQDEALHKKLEDMQRMAEHTVADLRRLTRDLRPIYLEDLGLTPALEMLVRDSAQSIGIPVTFETMGDTRRLEPEVELAFYRMAQEGLSNVARHSQAGRAGVCLTFDAETITLTVEDNGIGFEMPESPAEMAPAGHYGLLGVQERAEAIGARLVLDAEPGTGTRLQVVLPVNGLV